MSSRFIFISRNDLGTGLGSRIESSKVGDRLERARKRTDWNFARPLSSLLRIPTPDGILIFMKNVIARPALRSGVLQDQLNLQPAKLPENWPRHMLLFARSENICCGFPIKARSRANRPPWSRTREGWSGKELEGSRWKKERGKRRARFRLRWKRSVRLIVGSETARVVNYCFVNNGGTNYVPRGLFAVPFPPRDRPASRTVSWKCWRERGGGWVGDKKAQRWIARLLHWYGIIEALALHYSRVGKRRERARIKRNGKREWNYCWTFREWQKQDFRLNFVFFNCVRGNVKLHENPRSRCTNPKLL